MAQVTLGEIFSGQSLFFDEIDGSAYLVLSADNLNSMDAATKDSLGLGDVYNAKTLGHIIKFGEFQASVFEGIAGTVNNFGDIGRFSGITNRLAVVGDVVSVGSIVITAQDEIAAGLDPYAAYSGELTEQGLGLAIGWNVGTHSTRILSQFGLPPIVTLPSGVVLGGAAGLVYEYTGLGPWIDETITSMASETAPRINFSLEISGADLSDYDVGDALSQNDFVGGVNITDHDCNILSSSIDFSAIEDSGYLKVFTSVPTLNLESEFTQASSTNVRIRTGVSSFLLHDMTWGPELGSVLSCCMI